MFRPLAVFIGTRYTRAKRRSHFVSFISLTSILGLALGVLVMIVVMSVMNGFDREMQQRVLGMVPHATLESYQPLSDWRERSSKLLENPQVEAVAPFVQLRGLLSHQGKVQKILLSGIEPELERKVSIIDQFFRQGSLNSLKPGEFGIILGDKAVARLNLKVGDKLTFVAPSVAVTPAGVFPRMKRFTLVGVFHVGAGELDGYYGLVQRSDAALLQRWQADQVQGLRLKVRDLFAAPELAWQLLQTQQDSGHDFYASDWTRSHGNLYQAIRMEKSMIGLLLLLIVAVAAFNIVSTLIMVVNDKRADIAILRTLGATPRQILGIFMVQGAVIGLVGTLVGVLLGVAAALKVSAAVKWLEGALNHQFLNSEVYFIDYLPSQLQWGDVLMIASAALLLSFFATLYPAWRASRTQPAEALRYE